MLVTGVLNKRSIAFSVAKTVLAEGGQIALSYQSGDRLRDKVGRLAESELGNAPIYPLDVSSDIECDRIFNDINALWGTLDGLVHSVAYADREMLSGHYHNVTGREKFAQALDISAYSLTALASRSAALMGNNGSIVTLTYLGSQRAVPNYNVMGVAKAALESSMRYLAASLGPNGVRVNAVSAGPVKTLAASGIKDFGRMLDMVAKQSPLRRNVSQQEIANAVAFLLSERASGITGEIVHVDGGHNFSAGTAAAN